MESNSHSRRSSPAHRLIAALLWRQQLPDERVRSFILPETDLVHTYQRVLWSALLELGSTAQPLNCTTLAEALRDIGALVAIGGPRALTALSLDGQAVSGDLITLLYDVRDEAVRRRVLNLAQKLHVIATSDSGPFDDLVTSLRAEVDALAPLATRRLP